MSSHQVHSCAGRFILEPIMGKEQIVWSRWSGKSWLSSVAGLSLKKGKVAMVAIIPFPRTVKDLVQPWYCQGFKTLLTNNSNNAMYIKIWEHSMKPPRRCKVVELRYAEISFVGFLTEIYCFVLFFYVFPIRSQFFPHDLCVVIVASLLCLELNTRTPFRNTNINSRFCFLSWTWTFSSSFIEEKYFAVLSRDTIYMP